MWTSAYNSELNGNDKDIDNFFLFQNRVEFDWAITYVWDIF